MPLWGTGYPGSNPISALNFTDLRGGDDLALLDGTETVATGSKSIAFGRGYVPGNDDGSTFQVTGCAAGTIIAIQASNGVSQSGRIVTVTPTLANMDASFNTIATLAAGNGAYADVGRSAFYRVLVSTFVSGDVPVVIVKR